MPWPRVKFACLFSTTIAFLLLFFRSGIGFSEEVEDPGKKPANPHFAENRCALCHEGRQQSSLPLQKHDKLCISCHKDERIRTELHPTKVASHSGKVKQVPVDFPLNHGNLGCITCHDTKIQCLAGEEGRVFNPSFLRGGPYIHSYSICYRCHNIEYYELFDPHNQVNASGEVVEESCLYCHEKPVSKGGRVPAVGEYIEGICNSCHRGLSHLPGSDHMQKPNARMRAYIDDIEKQRNLHLPLDSNMEVYCATCHNPHEKGVFPDGDHRGVGSEGKNPSRHRVRVSGGVICVVCHQKS